MKILITGHDGFIGSALCGKLTAEGVDFIPYAGDILELNRLHETPDLIIHLAGRSRAKPEHAQDIHKINTLGTGAAVELALRTGAALLFASSAAVYAFPDRATKLTEQSPLNPLTPYARSKRLAEEGIANASQHQGLRAAILRIFNPYGVAQSTSFLIPYLIACFRNGTAPYLMNPENVLDFIHIDDLVEVFVKLLHKEFRPGCSVFNVGSGEGVKLEQLCAVIKHQLASEVEVERNEAGGHAYVVADISVLQAHIDWRPRVSIEEGIKRTTETR